MAENAILIIFSVQLQQTEISVRKVFIFHLSQVFILLKYKNFKKHVTLLLFWLWGHQGLLKRELYKPQGSTENDAKWNFLQNIYSE